MMSRKLSLSVAQGSALTFLLLSPSLVAQIDYSEFSGTLSQEWAFDLHRVDTQKLETELLPRWDIGWSNGMSLTAIGRLRFDQQTTLGAYPNGTDAQGEIRELYLDAQWRDSFWRIGKQQVVWGQADGLRVLDVINPLDYREFILGSFEDRRIPLWMVNAEFPVSSNWMAQLLWIPDTRYNELPPSSSDYRPSSPLLVPDVSGTLNGRTLRVNATEQPDNWQSDADYGVRLSAFLKGWDVSLNYFYHYLDQAVFYQQNSTSELLLQPRHERSHLLGGSLSNVFGETILRMEAGYSSDQYYLARGLARSETNPGTLDTGVQHSDELSYVIGLDWQPGSQWLLSGQLFQSIMFDHSSATQRDKTESQLTALLQRKLYNEALTLRALLIHGLNRGDAAYQLEAHYEYSSNLQLRLGLDLFDGDNNGLFGQFDAADRASIGLTWSF